MTGDCHVRFYERRGVRLPPATHRVAGRAGTVAIALAPCELELGIRGEAGSSREGEAPRECSALRRRARRPLA